MRSRHDRPPGPARSLIENLTSEFTELEGGVAPGDPLKWPGYPAARARAEAASGEAESVIFGEARIRGADAVLIVFDFSYMGGSVGEAAGDRVTRAFARARELRRPVVSLVASGGCRMQEGMRALVQLQRIAAQAKVTRDDGIAHISVARHPTTGGMWAALAAGADVLLGESGATVGFAGHRVTGQIAPADAELLTSEGKFLTGQVDEVVAPEDLAKRLGAWIEALAPGGQRRAAGAALPRALGASGPASSGWSAVLGARSPDRPRAFEYLDAHFDSRLPISGDRAGGRDPGMLCGFGRRGGDTVAYAAQTGTANTPAGFRTAARLLRLADRLRLPVLTLVDTPGAANDAAAERAGVGPALADMFGVMAQVSVPVTTLVVGEGGSGGALALCSPNCLWLTPDAYFSVIPPEPATAILKRPSDDVPLVADALRLRPDDLVELGIASGIATRSGPRDR